MRYSKNLISKFPKFYLIGFIFLFLSIAYVNKERLYRSIVNVNLWSLYIELVNEKAEIINYFNNNDIETAYISMSSNNYIKMQKERSKMVSNYVLYGDQWKGENQYYKIDYNQGLGPVKGEIRLFGMNIDHFRDSNSHSFRIKFKDDIPGFGSKQFNFLNPRTRDFITDPLLNIIYGQLYGGIKINYEPVRVNLNKARYGIFLKEEFFDKYLIEENHKRESVIFEIVDDSLKFNYLGEDNLFEYTKLKLEALYENDYERFINSIDIKKLRGVIVLASIINNNHPLIDLNLHWYYNPVNGQIEPTIREGFISPIDTFDIKKIISGNKIVEDLYNTKLKNTFYDDLEDEISKIKRIIKNDSQYNRIKSQLIGFKNKIKEKEKLIADNIRYIEKNLLKDHQQQIKEISEVVISKDTILKGNITITENEKLIIEKGVKIKLSDVYLKVYGGFTALGTKDNPIEIVGNKNQSGTIYFNTDDEIYISNVKFDGLSNNYSTQEQPASITFYESDSIEISNSNFSNNLSGDDYVNFFRSRNILVENSEFLNVINDAIDSDFSDLEINNSYFNNIGNDAVDGSGSKININNSYFNNIKDKGISAGERSKFKIINSHFTNNEIAIVSKDESILTIDNNNLENNILDFVSFVKKQYYNFPTTYFNSTEIENYLIEKDNRVYGIDSVNFEINIEEKLYGNLYGKATKK